MEHRILRATKEGVKFCYGEIFEHDGFQYCLCYVEDHWSAIELSTGMRSDGIEDCLLCLSSKEAFERIKEMVKVRPRSLMEKGIANAQIVLETHNIGFPLNQTIVFIKS